MVLGNGEVPRRSRRRFACRACAVWLGLGVATLFATSAAAAEVGVAPSQPNLVVIVADDLGYGDVCAYGCDRGRTPHLDALATSGARFTQAYVTAPVCSPSRAGLLTGRYQERFGHEFSVAANAGTDRAALGTPTTERMLPQYLADRGYATGMVGKWHLGAVPELHPNARGFDEFFGFLHSAHLYVDPARAGVHYVDRGPRRGVPLRPDPRNPLLRDSTPVDEPAYLTEAFTREAVSFIERHRAEPFFLYVAYNAPHAPLQVTDAYWQRFPEIEDEGERIYAAMVSALDDGVGAIVAELDRTGLRRDTLIVLTSDNGCATYTEVCSNGPLLGGKLTFFEGGVRVPFMVSRPGTIEGGQVVDTPASTLDILPTALELTGAPAPGDRVLDGRSLLPLLGDGSSAARSTGRDAGAEAAGTRFAAGSEAGAHDHLFWRSGASWATRQGSWKLVQYPNRPPLLFDLAVDPGESRDLAAAQAARIAELTREYRAWDAQMIAPLWPVRLVFYAVLKEILDRGPVRLLEAPAPGTIAVEF